MVICLERCADLHMAQLMPLPLTVSCSSKTQLVLPFWYRLTPVVLDKGTLNGCVCYMRQPNLFLAFVFVFILCCSTFLLNAFSALTLLVGQQEEHPACKN